MRLAAIVIEENAWRPVQLRHDDALGTVDHERSVLGHEWNFTHVNVLFLYVLNGLRAGLFIINNEADFDSERAGISCAAQHTFINVKNGGA